jgi:hypothetical protein
MRVGASCLLAAVALFALPARGEQRLPGEYHHDGVYVRLGAGVGVVRDSVHMTLGGSSGFDEKGTVTGFGQANELAVGGALAPGLILAGGFFLNVAYGVSRDFGDVDTQSGDGYAVLTWGPLVDYYPDPDGGLHFELGFGLGATSGVAPASRDDAGGATGYGLILGVGQEWWIAKQWAMGGMLRLQHVEAKDNIVTLLGPELDADHSANAVSLMFTATFN